ncbi:MAG: radical SAM protein [Candidatus Omnitrophica bacterium]|nr:radical SAM protein [Candidatus Omnitrophota bacterium]
MKQMNEGVKEPVEIVSPVPTFSCFTLCDNCVLKCRMCYKWQPDLYIKPERKQLGLEDWKRCAISLKKIAPENFVVNFGGGEVTTMPWLFDIVSFCHELGFKTNIATNGFLVDAALVCKMHASGLDYVNISLDSLNETTHDMLRGVKGVYKKVMQAIKLIHSHAPQTQISICSIMMEPSLEGIVQLVRWVQENPKVAMIYLMAIMQPNNTHADPLWYENKFNHLWPKDAVRAAEIIDEVIALKQKGYKIANRVEHLHAYKTYFFDPRAYVKKSACNIDCAVHISSVGDVFMCYRYAKIGDVREGDLENIWTNDLAAQVRVQIHECRENCHFLLNCNFDG